MRLRGDEVCQVGCQVGSQVMHCQSPAVDSGLRGGASSRGSRGLAATPVARRAPLTRNPRTTIWTTNIACRCLVPFFRCPNTTCLAGPCPEGLRHRSLVPRCDRQEGLSLPCDCDAARRIAAGRRERGGRATLCTVIRMRLTPPHFRRRGWALYSDRGASNPLRRCIVHRRRGPRAHPRPFSRGSRARTPAASDPSCQS